MDKTGTTTPQDIMLDLIEGASFNAFDGKKVAGDLRANRALWDSALMLSDAGLMLRDLAGDSPIWHADTLWLLTKIDRMEPLKRVVVKWEADAVRWTTDDGEWEMDEPRMTKPKPKTKRVSKGNYKGYASSFLGSGRDESAVVFRLWWD